MSDLPNGKALGKTFLVDKNDLYTLNQRICSLTLKNPNNIAKFFFYVLNRNKEFLKFDNGIDQTNLKKSDILNAQIPFPPIAIQKRIVDLLDKLDYSRQRIVNILNEDIQTLTQQYDFYCNKLLTFEIKQNLH